MLYQQFVDLVTAAHDGIQCRHGLLKDHRHAHTSQASQACDVGGEQILAVEQDFPCARAHIARQQAHHRVRDDRLAGSRFAQQAQHVAGANF